MPEIDAQANSTPEPDAGLPAETRQEETSQPDPDLGRPAEVPIELEVPEMVAAERIAANERLMAKLERELYQARTEQIAANERRIAELEAQIRSLDEPVGTAPEEIEELVEARIEAAAPGGEQVEEVAAEDVPAEDFNVDGTAWSIAAPQSDGYVLSLDFGTAKSKAFAASVNGDPEDADLVELALGRRDNDLDAAVYTVASSVWISNDGLLYAGSEALRKSMQSGVVGNVSRRRLDSVKQQLTLISVEQNLASLKLESDINPTKVELSYEDAVCFYLAYLTDLAVSELASRGHSRYIRRRFTIPAWRASQRAWAAPILAKLLVRAQVLADTFHGRWANGIPAETLKTVMAVAKSHESELLYLLDGYNGKSGAFPNGLLEPLAAGSGRIMADRHARNLVLVVDIGAGTTDFSLFWSVQGPKGRKAFPVEPCSGAVRVAGDILDEILIAELLRRADGGSGEWMRKRFETEIRHSGVRRMKETLFRTGRLDVSVADQNVSIELQEFLENDRVLRFGQTIEDAIKTFLGSVDSTWQQADQALLVLTGGGASLPMIKNFANKYWDLGGRQVMFKAAEAVPEVIQTFSTDFQNEYPQLAVAIGGALPVLDERFNIKEFAGAATRPGPLERF